jgi:hypothetical protein
VGEGGLRGLLRVFVFASACGGCRPRAPGGFRGVQGWRGGRRRVGQGVQRVRGGLREGWHGEQRVRRPVTEALHAVARGGSGSAGAGSTWSEVGDAAVPPWREGARGREGAEAGLTRRARGSSRPEGGSPGAARGASRSEGPTKGSVMVGAGGAGGFVGIRPWDPAVDDAFARAGSGGGRSQGRSRRIPSISRGAAVWVGVSLT